MVPSNITFYFLHDGDSLGKPTQTTRDYKGMIRGYLGLLGLIGVGRLPWPGLIWCHINTARDRKGCDGTLCFLSLYIYISLSLSLSPPLVTYVYTYIYIYTCKIYANKWIDKYVYILYMYVCTYISLHTQICTYACVHVYIHMYIYVHHMRQALQRLGGVISGNMRYLSGCVHTRRVSRGSGRELYCGTLLV